MLTLEDLISKLRHIMADAKCRIYCFAAQPKVQDLISVINRML